MKALLLSGAVSAIVLLSSCQTTEAVTRVRVDYPYVVNQARDLVQRPYDPEWTGVPEVLAELTYDQHRDIRFRSDEALWANEDLPFRVEFFHPGYIFRRPVDIYEFTERHAQEIRFATSFFNYGANTGLAEEIPSTMGYAGFRIRYPINRQEVFDEIAVFLGASYFRVIGRNQVYGLSARGLAIDTGENTGEEFPEFRAFWLGKPAAGDERLVIYALLDSPRVTGGYEFIIEPGATTKVSVRATIFLRAPVKVLGLAPFSSMFLFGENTVNRPNDFRPEVHDSDGLLIQSGTGEFLWRPLGNAGQTRLSDFQFQDVRAFGLLQRDRNFEHYQDIEAAYHLRPNAWVVPKGDWGPGSVRLLEIAVREETFDNIAVLWSPATLPPLGQPFEFAYDIFFGAERRSPAGQVVATRIGRSLNHPDDLEIVIDFAGDRLADLAEVEPLTGRVDVGPGASLEWHNVRKNPYNDTWRLALRIRPDGSNRPVELRGFLQLGEEALTETWTYQWTP